MLQGVARWAKIVGEPVPAYTKGEFEWTTDIEIDEVTQEKLREDGAERYLKERDDGTVFVKFQRKSVKKDGSPGKPFGIVDHAGQPWDTRLIGNGSVLNVKYEYNEVGVGKEKRMKPSAIKFQVVKYVPYQGKDDFPVYDNDGKEEWSSDED